MITSRLTNCPECITIPVLLEDIECQITTMAIRLYNNVVFSLHQSINTNSIFDLLQYKRILQYKICNIEYAGCFTVEMIASRIKLLTAGCKTRCYASPVSSDEDPYSDCTIEGVAIDVHLTTTTTSTSSSSTSSTTTSSTTTGTSTTLPPIVEEYGYLYNWYAVTNAKNITNTGWRVPSWTDLQNLVTTLGGSSLAGPKLKETGIVYWENPNNATNSSGFSARGGGHRASSVFLLLKSFAEYHSTTPDIVTGDPICLALYGNTNTATIQVTGKNTGVQCRILRDTILANGTIGSYTGNDGNIYSTIVIGTQEWLSEELKETQYRDHSPIPELQDNTAWLNNITGARCYYVI